METSEQNKSWLIKSGYFLNDYWPEILTPVIGLLSVLSGFLFEIQKNQFGWIFAGLVVPLQIVLSVYVIKRQKSSSKLEEEVGDKSNRIQKLERDLFEIMSQFESLRHTEIRVLSERLNFTEKHRISIYKKEGDVFVMLERYSKNPELNKKGRGIYPSNEGFISKGYTEGTFFINNLPDPEKEHESYFQKITTECTIEKETLAKLRMKSKSYYVKALEDEYGDNRIAVIVFESINKNDLSKSDIDYCLDDEKVRILKLLRFSERFQPHLNTLRNEGF